MKVLVCILSLLVLCCYFVFYHIGAFYSPLLYHLWLCCVLLYSFDGELDRNECGGNVYLQSCSSESITLISTAGSHQPLAMNTSCSFVFWTVIFCAFFVFLYLFVLLITSISTAGSHQPLALNTSCSLSIFLILPVVLYFQN